MQPDWIGHRTTSVRAVVFLGRAWEITLVAALALACRPGDEPPLALRGEPGLPAGNEVAIEAQRREQSSARSGGSAVEFDDIILFPVAIQGPGLGAYSTNCDLDDDPFGTCL